MCKFLRSLFPKNEKSVTASPSPTQRLVELSKIKDELCNKFMYLREEDKRYFAENRAVPKITVEVVESKTCENNIELKATTQNNDELGIKGNTEVFMHFSFGKIPDNYNLENISGKHIIYLGELQRIKGSPCGVARLLMINLYNLKEELTFSNILLNPVAASTIIEGAKNDEELKAFYKKYLHIDEDSFVQGEPPLEY